MPNSFEMIIETEQENGSGGGGGGRKSSTNTGKGEKNNQNGFDIPEIIPIQKDEWITHGMDQYSALEYVSTDEGGDYYLNMDNTYLLTELKGTRDQNKIELTKARYTYSMALIAMSVIGYYKNSKEEIDVGEQVSKITTMVAPILIPMLESMADLSIAQTVA